MRTSQWFHFRLLISFLIRKDLRSFVSLFLSLCVCVFAFIRGVNVYVLYLFCACMVAIAAIAFHVRIACDRRKHCDAFNSALHMIENRNTYSLR